MPYADPEKRREAQARWFREKYSNNKKFRAEEAKRKARWLQDSGKESNRLATERYRKKKMAEVAAAEAAAAKAAKPAKTKKKAAAAKKAARKK